MANRLLGKRTLITAAGQGIGRATALAFAREGARVLATDVNADALATLRQECPAVEIESLDVRDQPAIVALAASIGAIDVLFNCAGFVHQGTILDCEEADWERSLAINVTSMYRVSRAFLPAMLEAHRGNIINMSSVVSSVKGAPGRFAYGTTKAAVIGLTKSIAADFVTEGIRCNAICPGTVQTPSLERRLSAQGDYDRTRQAFVARQPMGRFGAPEEIAELAVYLASDESAYTTGSIHVVDGGWCI